ncbi:hypothetical protein B9Z19DRAFT_1088116 [Tuber borchii]|uniref:Uncharacterized protein n=1 Tax=Tuber borchii TaxID=42251 RepID=A0A2T6ZM18_TUBBO|nr:hypothetical protein B9Z19DRAFT_1088116 [Tuber borchii]
MPSRALLSWTSLSRSFLLPPASQPHYPAITTSPNNHHPTTPPLPSFLRSLKQEPHGEAVGAIFVTLYHTQIVDR